eukprot:gene4435-7810_t
MDLEKEYDIILAETNVTNSILSFAFSRIGKSVLHLDENDYYGGEHGTLSLEEIFNLKDNDSILVLNKSESLTEELKKEKRKFNIDLTCKPFYSNGSVINKMIKSGVGRNMEFKVINYQFLFLENTFVRIPFSKGEIFKNKFLKLTEKTYLMKFLSNLNEEEKEEGTDYQSSFKKYLKDKYKLNERLTNIILYSLILLPNNKIDITINEGLKKLKLFISSIGRFGSISPFLYPLYGMSEMTQIFCRASSVYGGTIVLRRNVKEVISSNEIKTTENDIIKFNSFSNIKKEKEENKFNQLKSIIISNESLFDLIKQDELDDDDKKEEFENSILMGVIPPNDNLNTIFILQLNWTTQCCSKGKYLIYISTCLNNEDNDKIEIEFKERIKKLNIKKEFEITYKHKCSTNSFSMEEEMDKAEQIFKNVFPNDEFLLKTIDPNEQYNEIDKTSELLGIKKDEIFKNDI